MSITIVQLARRAGVSDATVSLVLSGKDRGRVSARVRERVLAVARRSGYRLNPAAKALVEGRTYRIGVCVDGTIASHAIIGEFSMHVRLGLFAQGIQSAGYAIEIVQADRGRSPEETGDLLARKAVDGCIFLNWKAPRLKGVISRLNEGRIPSIASGTNLSDDALTWTDVDNAGSFREAVRLLARDGRRNIALLDTVIGDCPPECKNGYLEAHRGELRRDGRRTAFRTDALSFDGVREMTCRVMKLKPRPTGLIVADNYYGQAVLEGLRQRGITPGKECRVIGYGDTSLADQCSPKLSHFGLRVEEQVAFGMQAILDAMRTPSEYQPRHLLLPPEYVSRET